MILEKLRNSGVITVIYHYVRDNQVEGTPNLKSLDVGDFERQIDWLLENFEPLSFEEFDYYTRNDLSCPPNKFLLTFDDGLKDHYKYVFKILKEKKLFGFFFISSSVYTNNKPLEVHIIHFLLEKLGGIRFTEYIREELKKRNIKIENKPLRSVYRYDDMDYSTIKKIMNYYLEYQVRDEILNTLFFDFFKSYSDFCNEVYLSKDEIKEMTNEGMIFGNHTHSHKVLSRLSTEEQIFEIRKCNEYLRDNFDISKFIFCYPYGHDFTYNENTKMILKKLGCHSAFNNIRKNTDIRKSNKFELYRYDTRDILCNQ